MSVLDRYIVRAILSSVLLVMLVILALGALARGSELTVVRASGVSIARLAGMTLLAGLLLIFVELLLGELLAPPLQQAAREQKAFSKLSNVSFGGGGGAWVRDGDLILNVAGQYSQRQFGSMQIFELSPQHRLIALGHATRATAGSRGRWLLSDYTESRFADDAVTTRPPGQRLLASNVTAGFLGLDRKSTRLNSSHSQISYAVFCLKKKKKKKINIIFTNINKISSTN